MVLGRDPTTFSWRVSSHNHQSRPPARIENFVCRLQLWKIVPIVLSCTYNFWERFCHYWQSPKFWQDFDVRFETQQEVSNSNKLGPQKMIVTMYSSAELRRKCLKFGMSTRYTQYQHPPSSTYKYFSKLKPLIKYVFSRVLRLQCDQVAR